jgi:hypothetical protein
VVRLKVTFYPLPDFKIDDGPPQAVTALRVMTVAQA